MPLRAIIDGTEYSASLLDDSEWKALRDRVRQTHGSVRLPCCGAMGHFRISNKGTKHFYHASTAECSWGPETEWHLLAKSEIIRACVAAGWNATTEVTGDGWRADVMASKDSVRLAFEVQWSSQTDEELRSRQECYARDGVRGCWFIRKPPRSLIQLPEKAIPAFSLLHNDPAAPLAVKNLERVFPLHEFVGHLLNGHVRFCETVKLAPVQNLRVIFYEVDCWKCHSRVHDYCVENGYTTPCGLSAESFDIAGYGNDLNFEPQIVAAVQEFVRSPAGCKVHLGAIKPRYSATIGRSYMSTGCARCGVLFGDFYKAGNLADALYTLTEPPTSIDISVHFEDAIRRQHPHWCFSERGERCE